MGYQTSRNGYVALKAQSGLNSPASGSGAKILPITGGKGTMTKQAVSSNLVRRDGLRTRGRHGTQASTGSYPSELLIGTVADDIHEAVMRGTYATGATITQATGALSSATISVSGATVTFSAGSVITAGVRVGEVHRWTVGLDAADLNDNLVTVGVTATSITYHKALTTVAGPVNTYSFSQPGRSVVNPATPVRRYWTLEEAELDIDGSEVFEDCMFGSMQFQMQPNGLVMPTYGWTGTGKFSALEAGSAPYFSSPADYTGTPLSVSDAVVRVGSETLVDMMSFDLTFDLGLSSPAVAASKYGADVFDGSLSINGSIQAMRKDLARVADYVAETQLSLYVLAEGEASGGVKPFFFIYLPNWTLGNVDKSEFSREGGPKTQTMQIPADLVGVDERGGAYSSTMARIQISNAS